MPLLEQRLFLKYASTHLDNLILTATFDELSASYSVPIHHILFEGRCRNLSSLQSSNQLQRNEYSFLCLHRLCDIHSSVTDDEEGSEKRPDPIVQLPSLSDLQSPFSTAAGTDLLLELSLRYRPNPHNILVVFCADSVHDCLHFSAAQMSIILVSSFTAHDPLNVIIGGPHLSHPTGIHRSPLWTLCFRHKRGAAAISERGAWRGRGGREVKRLTLLSSLCLSLMVCQIDRVLIPISGKNLFRTR
jgi:hypothetical protein